MAKEPKEPKPLKLSDIDPRKFMEMIIFSALITSQIDGASIEHTDTIKIVEFRTEAKRVASIYFDLEED